MIKEQHDKIAAELLSSIDQLNNKAKTAPRLVRKRRFLVAAQKVNKKYKKHMLNFHTLTVGN